jgi:hypothetical protein
MRRSLNRTFSVAAMIGLDRLCTRRFFNQCLGAVALVLSPLRLLKRVSFAVRTLPVTVPYGNDALTLGRQQ